MSTNDEHVTGQLGVRRAIVLVGHCLPDESMLSSAIKRSVEGAAIATANDRASLEPHLHSGAVLLVNRVLDGAFETRCGIDLIGRLVNGADSPVCLLISNYDEAQKRAIAAGARPGFGKSGLYEAETAERLRDAALKE